MANIIQKAQFIDKNSDEVVNVSTVSGATVSDALDTLEGAQHLQPLSQEFEDLPLGPPVDTFTLASGTMFFGNLITPDGDDGSFILTVGDNVGDGATRYKYSFNNDANLTITGGPSAFTLAVGGVSHQYVWTLSQADLTTTLNAATAVATGTTIFNMIKIDPN